jgi:hypothetical protein
MLQTDLDTAIDLAGESSKVDYKSRFDAASQADWLEVTKDVVAMANSGGGMVIFGIEDDGSMSKFDCGALSAVDPAMLTDKIHKYSGRQFGSFHFWRWTRNGCSLFAIIVNAVDVPIVFTRVGTYDVGGGKQKTAFSAGTIYFRHGTKSEPADSDDLRTFIESRIEQMRKTWFEGITKVVEAPIGSGVQITPPSSGEQTQPVRLVNDPAAPAYRHVSVDETHPFRQKEVVEEFNKATANAKRIVPYHIQCVRQIHKVDENPTFCCRMRHASSRYSTAFVEWLVQNYKDNETFFEDAKARVREAYLSSKKSS